MLYRRPQQWPIRAHLGRTHLAPTWQVVPRGLARQADWEGLETSDEEVDTENAGSAHATEQKNGRCMGIVSARVPSSASVQDLVEKIHTRSLGLSRPNARPSLLVLLLTPRFARQALSTDLPLQVLNRIGRDPTQSKPLDAITAVVDRLPVNDEQRPGVEGLGYIFLTHPPPLQTNSQAPLQVSAQKPGSIRWAIPRFKKGPHLTVQLPLAHTVFSTGLPSTLVHTQYQYDEQSKALVEPKSQHLESQQLRVPTASPTATEHLRPPLVPLTPLRRVTNCMGNIVRKVSPNTVIEDLHLQIDATYTPNAQAFMTASQELEAAVSDYFKAVNISPEPVEVWALIMPNAPSSEAASFVPRPYLALEKETIRGMWTSPQDLAKFLESGQWLKLLAAGGRLCKVLSGGGGWGKKAGLLSLDPDTWYTTRELRGDTGWDFDFEDDGTTASFERQQAQALGQIVKEGEGIMFLLAPKHFKSTPGAPPSTPVHPGGRATFGVLPSSIDSFNRTETTGPESDEGGTAALTHYPDIFGMLSEGGMAVQFLDKEGVIRSKADIPFARVDVTTSAEPGKQQNHFGKRVFRPIYSQSKATVKSGVIRQQVMSSVTHRSAGRDSRAPDLGSGSRRAVNSFRQKLDP